MSEFEGRYAVVTGAGSGIGRATAIRLASGGALVGVNDLDAASADATVQTILADGGSAEPLVYDVTAPAIVDDALETFVRRHGSLDVLVNNAGYLQSVPGHAERRATFDERKRDGVPTGSLGVTVHTTDEIWHRHFDVLLHAVFYGTRAALRHMEPAGRGAIVNTASIGALHPSPDYPYYAAAKAAVIAFTSSVAHEVAGAGIRVNAVAPGPTATGITKGMATGSSFRRSAAGRIGDPAEVAEAIAFLASDRSSYCFGEVLTVSGAFA